MLLDSCGKRTNATLPGVKRNFLVDFIIKLCNLKVAYSQKGFHFGSNLSKNVPNQYSELYPHKEKIPCILWEIGAHLKNSLR